MFLIDYAPSKVILFNFKLRNYIDEFLQIFNYNVDNP